MLCARCSDLSPARLAGLPDAKKSSRPGAPLHREADRPQERRPAVAQAVSPVPRRTMAGNSAPYNRLPSALPGGKDAILNLQQMILNDVAVPRADQKWNCTQAVNR